jgi:tRNA A37 methylthiotransferase MiaB
MYSYSERPGTLAAKWKMMYPKKSARRLQEIVDLQQNTPALEQFIGQIVEVLVEKFQKIY